MTIRIEVDFNSRDDAGMVPALVEATDAPLRVGDLVEAFDDEGYRCPAVVARVEGGIVALDPAWRAFAAPGEARIVLTSAPPAMWAEWKNRLTIALAPVSVVQPAFPATGSTPAHP